MYGLARQALFALPPETSHDVAIAALQAFGRLTAPRPLAGSPVRCFGLQFPNRVGLAAGLDKEGRAAAGLARLGFGFVEVGTVTPKPQPGNPKPRLFRLRRERALINRMGFNSGGLASVVPRLAALRSSGRMGDTVLGVNLGKNKDTSLDRAAEDYVTGLKAVYEFADYLTLNLSSPNTPGLRTLQSADALKPLLSEVLEARASMAQAPEKPLLLKVAPDLAEEDLDVIAQTVGLLGIDGVIATNTTIRRDAVPVRWHNEAGGLSGQPLFDHARSTVQGLRTRLPDDVPIVGVGGIGDVSQGQAMLDAGATLVQIYTGFIYEGPNLVRSLQNL